MVAAVRGPKATEEPEDIIAAYLPAVLRQDAFLSNFLRVFDSIERPLLQMLDAIDCYFDPALTRVELLPWLATWVGEDLPETWSASARRALIKEAASIHRARGTKAGLKRALELVSGRKVLLTENTAGLRLDGDAQLGINTSLQDAEPNTIQVVICGGGDGVDLGAVTEVIERLKPAHAAFTIRTAE
jgi:phage tail-like protein